MEKTKFKQLDLFRDTKFGESMRMNLRESMELTIDSLKVYGANNSTWVLGFSGGKDSTATVTFVHHAIAKGLIARPKNLIVAYADTLMELPSLDKSAQKLLNFLAQDGWRIIKTEPALETKPTKTERFFVTMLGRGYPPPSNRFRWCTDRMKANKIDNIYSIVEAEYGPDFLGIDGIRKGESAARDRLIYASCSSDDGECGQGWFHKNQRGTAYKLSPLLHWRICHVWDWLFMAELEHGYPIRGVSETYGVLIEDDFSDLSGRTGCIGCPLVTASNQSKPKPDKALSSVLLSPRWDHLSPYQGLSLVYWQLRWNDSARVFKSNGKKGCLTLEAREWALNEILKMQSESIKLALANGKTPYLLIRPDEEELIRKMLSAKTYPSSKGYEENAFEGVSAFSLE